MEKEGVWISLAELLLPTDNRTVPDQRFKVVYDNTVQPAKYMWNHRGGGFIGYWFFGSLKDLQSYQD